ncbi:MAG: AAA family ATPase, partial [Candidatus Sumerlaeia bacterium]|nr:AAA family ATPase [Candidatus Sumerlaeia bacterium]
EIFCRFLQNADTGIGDLSVEESEVDEEELGRLPLEFLEENSPATGAHLALRVADDIHVYTKGKNGSIRRLEIRVGHQSGKNGRSRFFPISDESDGTRRLMHLIPMLIPTAIPAPVFIVDELNRSLHPLLSRSLLQTFLRGEPGVQDRQLILTTHETLLLDLDLLRRDEIWFIEKDNEGASSLRSLQEYKVRKDLRIEKGYLSGRFGAIPIMGAPLCGQEVGRE